MNGATLAAVLLAIVALSEAKLVKTASPPKGTLPFLDDSDQKEVITFNKFPDGYEPATTEEEWKSFFRDNLQQDLEPYRRRYKETRKKLTTRHLATQLVKVYTKPSLRTLCGVVIIRNNKIYAHTASRGDPLWSKRIHRNLAVLADHSEKLGLDLPDTVLIMNGYDEPVCRAAGGCVAPVFSMLKRFERRTNKNIDVDLLFPHMGHAFHKLFFYPWKEKDPRGLLRASLQNTMDPAKATRIKLANLSASSEGAPYLDVGIVKNNKDGYKMPKAYDKEYMAIGRHASYKFLINANGHTASVRRGHIMQCNSVTMEEETHWIEYYWRSLKPYVHYLPYTAKTILPLLKEYRDPGRDGELRAIANASQHFVAKYLTLEGKVRYAVRALHEYNELFDGLSEFVRGFKGLKPELAPVVWQQMISRNIAGDASDLFTTRPYRSARYLAGSFSLDDLASSLQEFTP